MQPYLYNLRYYIPLTYLHICHSYLCYLHNYADFDCAHEYTVILALKILSNVITQPHFYRLHDATNPTHTVLLYVVYMTHKFHPRNPNTSRKKRTYRLVDTIQVILAREILQTPLTQPYKPRHVTYKPDHATKLHHATYQLHSPNLSYLAWSASIQFSLRRTTIHSRIQYPTKSTIQP